MTGRGSINSNFLTNVIGTNIIVDYKISKGLLEPIEKRIQLQRMKTVSPTFINGQCQIVEPPLRKLATISLYQTRRIVDSDIQNQTGLFQEWTIDHVH